MRLPLLRGALAAAARLNIRPRCGGKQVGAITANAIYRQISTSARLAKPEVTNQRTEEEIQEWVDKELQGVNGNRFLSLIFTG